MNTRSLKTVVIPAAGLGTRMLPATKAIPKEMLCIVNKPLIQLIVDEVVAAGFEHIVFVTHSSKSSIENHFDTSFELESTLESRMKRAQLDAVQKIIPPHVKITSVRQSHALGLGHAILCARHVVGETDFAVVLPDVLLRAGSYDPATQNLAAMAQNFLHHGSGQILVQEVPMHKVSDYGVVDLAFPVKPGETSAIRRTVEKPAVHLAPSNLAVVGRYVLPREIWPFLERQTPGAGKEIQLTDAIEALIESGITMDAYGMHGSSFDCGTKIGLAMANAAYAMNDLDMHSEFISFLQRELSNR